MLRPDVSAVDFGLRYRAGGPGDVLEEDADLRGDGPVASFLLPPVADPAAYVSHRFNVYTGDGDKEHQMKFLKGTTTLAFKFKGGVIVSVDSRSTQGPYIASGSVKKVIEMNPYLLGTMAGGAADCSFWERDLGMRANLYQLRNKERISVAAASKLLVNTLYAYRGYGLSLGSMICGWDKTGPAIYYVDNDGTRLRASDTRPFFSVGSGSIFAYGVLDANWRSDMTDEEAIDLGQRAIYHATHRDGMSGGINNVYIIKPEGWRRVWSGDVNELHEKYLREGTTAVGMPAHKGGIVGKVHGVGAVIAENPAGMPAGPVRAGAGVP